MSKQSMSQQAALLKRLVVTAGTEKYCKSLAVSVVSNITEVTLSGSEVNLQLS